MSRGRFYARLESTEWSLLDDLDGPAPFDGAMLTDRYLGPWPKDHPQADEPADRLAIAVVAAGRPFVVDPDVARLEHPDSVALQSPRDALRPLARALVLPLGLHVLRSPAGISAMIDAAQISQVRASAFSAPYLEVGGPDDPRLQANVELLRASRDVANGRAVVGFLQALHGALVRGEALAAARKLARHSDVLVIRARRVRPVQITPPQVRALTELVNRLAQEGVRVVVDCAGPAGPPLVAAGADGFSAGSYHFQTVPAALHPAPGGGGGDALMPYVPLSQAGSSAGVAATAALVPSPEVYDKSATRIANLGTMQQESRRAAALGPTGYADLLVRAGLPQGQVWAAELRRVAARAA